jgi:hypothetical protein
MPSAEPERPHGAEPGCHAHDPSTSYQAARQFKESGKLGIHRQIVLDGVRRCNGGTHSEIAAVTPLDWLQVARRLSELERDGLVVKGEPRTCSVKRSRCCTWWVTDNAQVDPIEESDR